MPPSSWDTKMPGLFNSQKFSDLVVRCGKEKWFVHKNIICTQSEFFEKASEGGWQEAQDGVVTLKEDRPDVAHAMLHFLYTDDYTPPTNTDKKALPAIEFHVQMFAMAEKYFIEDLKHKAAKKFTAEYKAGCTKAEFADAMQAYSTLVTDQHKTMRRTIVDVIAGSNKWFLEQEPCEQFDTAFAEIPGIAADVASALSKVMSRASLWQRWLCPTNGCNGYFVSAKPPATGAKCKFCKFPTTLSGDASAWTPYKLQSNSA